MQETKVPLDSFVENDLALDLENILLNAKKSSVDWQAAVAKLTGLAHIRTLNEATSDFEYLRLQALCRWAQKIGVIEAKKKNIQATRFRTAAPPPLQSLGRAELVSAALELFVNLRGSWCKNYIANELLNPHVDKKSLVLLLEWAEKLSISATEHLEIILIKSTGQGEDEKRALYLIKDVASRTSFSNSLSATAAAADFFTAVQLTSQTLISCHSKKIRVGLMSLLQALVQKVRTAHPSVVVQGAFVFAIQTVEEQLAETSHKKAVGQLAAQQIYPTLSVLADLCHIGGQDGVGYSKLLLSSLTKAYSKFDKIFEDACRKNPSLRLLKDDGANQEGVHLEDTATSLYARLLPTWLDFYKSQKEPDTLAVFNADLLSAAKLNGIEFLGTVGEVLTFDPVAHRLESALPSSPCTVFIVRPAVIFKRANSSYRIVLPAMVSPT